MWRWLKNKIYSPQRTPGAAHRDLSGVCFKEVFVKMVKDYMDKAK